MAAENDFLTTGLGAITSRTRHKGSYDIVYKLNILGTIILVAKRVHGTLKKTDLLPEG